MLYNSKKVNVSSKYMDIPRKRSDMIFSYVLKIVYLFLYVLVIVLKFYIVQQVREPVVCLADYQTKFIVNNRKIKPVIFNL